MTWLALVLALGLFFAAGWTSGAVVALGAFAFFAAGFLFAIACYPDKDEIVDRIKRERGAS